MTSPHKYKHYEIIFGTIVVLSFVVVLYPGITNMSVVGDDAILHLKWIEEFNKIKDNGVFYPRFCGDFQSHLGSPIFYFYPPLSFFTAWCFHNIDASLTPNSLFQIVQLFATILSFGTFFIYSRSFTKRTFDRILSSLLYCSLPYRFLDAFVRSAFSEHFAFIFIPVVLLGVERARNRSLTGAKSISAGMVVITALSWASLILSSIPMTAIILTATVPYLFFRVRIGRIRYWSEYTISLLLGMVLAAGYLLPFASFIHLVEHDNVFKYSSEFRYSIYFLSQNKSDNYMLPSIMLVASVLLFIILRKSSNKFVLLLLDMGAVVQIPYIADPLWHSHIFDAVVYPMRFCALLCIAIPLCFLLSGSKSRRQVLAVLAITLILSGYREIKWIVNHSSTPRIDIANVTWDTPSEYRLITPVNASPNKPVPDTALSDGESIVETNRYFNHSSYHMLLFKPKTALLDRTFWPTWSARSSTGQELPLSCTPDGRISAELPAGSYEMDIRIIKSSAETIGAAISSITFVFMLTFAAGYWSVSHVKQSRRK